MYNDLWKEFEKNGDVQSYLKYRAVMQASVSSSVGITDDGNCEKDTAAKTDTDYVTV